MARTVYMYRGILYNILVGFYTDTGGKTLRGKQQRQAGQAGVTTCAIRKR